jgi:hypothetical protein
MRLPRSVTEYTRLDKIRRKVIRKELEISGIQDVRSKHKTGSTILKEQKTSDFRNTPLTTNLDGEEIVDAPRKGGKAPVPEQVKRTKPWRKRMVMMMMTVSY